MDQQNETEETKKSVKELSMLENTKKVVSDMIQSEKEKREKITKKLNDTKEKVKRAKQMLTDSKEKALKYNKNRKELLKHMQQSKTKKDYIMEYIVYSTLILATVGSFSFILLYIYAAIYIASGGIGLTPPS